MRATTACSPPSTSPSTQTSRGVESKRRRRMSSRKQAEEKLAQDGAAVVAGIDDAGPRGKGRQLLRDLPAQRLQRLDVRALARGEQGPGGSLVGRGHDHRPDEVVIADALEEVEGHSGLRSGRLRANADHSSVALRLNSIALSHSSSE